MKAVILAGGYGSRISEETLLKPKPMVEIGGRPILWHILKTYSAFGVKDFVICCGYKGYLIKEYFANYFLHSSDVTFDIKRNRMQVHEKKAEPWAVTVVDTGEGTQTGGRLKRIACYLREEKSFCFTYGDGLSDINLRQLVAFHKANRRRATITAVRPPGRYGVIHFNRGASSVSRFTEKPTDGAWINGGFFVLDRTVLDEIGGDQTNLEAETLKKLAEEGDLSAYRHEGFWHAMDTLRDKNYLESLWSSGKAPWKIWA